MTFTHASDWRGRPLPSWAPPIRRWRLAALPLLVGSATAALFYLPPANDLREPQVWMTALVAAVLGVARGAVIRMRVDQRAGKLSLGGAPEAFWIAVVAALFSLAGLLADPVGAGGSSFVKTVELALVVLSGFLVGRNAALAVRSRDAPHHAL